MKEEKLFPKINKTLNSFIEDEEGSIPAGKLLTVGTLIILLGTILSVDAFAKHGSHRSHSSHSSHSSSSYHRSHGSHSNSHSSHASTHGSHASHTSHSNTASHSNSNYSAGGDYGTPPAPLASSIKAPANTQSISRTIPNFPASADTSTIIPMLQTPQNTPNIEIKIPETMQELPSTPTPIDDKLKQ